MTGPEALSTPGGTVGGFPFAALVTAVHSPVSVGTHTIEAFVTLNSRHCSGRKRADGSFVCLDGPAEQPYSSYLFPNPQQITFAVAAPGNS